MSAVELAKDLKVIVDEIKTDEYLSILLNHTISQLEHLSDFESLLCRTYENKKIAPLLKRIKNKIDSNDGNINLEKCFGDFVDLYSSCETLYHSFVSKTPLFKKLEQNLTDSFNEKIEEYDEAFNKKNTEFSNKLTSLQTALGQAQTNSSAIETIHKNATTLGNSITTMEAEYKTAKNNYTEQKTKYDELILSITKKEQEIEKLKSEIREIKTNNSNELEELREELETEKEKIKDILGLANMASMAKAFLDRKKELYKPIYWSAFWRNLGLILLFSGISALLYFEFSNTFDYIRFLSRLPLSLPLIWLVWTNAQRNNHLVRVQEEYAYKAAVATAFEGYQRKVDETEDRDLKKLLLELSIKNMGDDPVRLFDKNVKNSPFETVLEKLCPIKNKKEDA
ncbi:hypothetical protein CEP48_00830 [Mergibacter septicus]|uniref:Uncharacterized protein n=1 Tax=Mergibacter septicus TaxID=221402 RepID=A0A8E3MF25_9PAST|nr:hypothetical protein [Mergibacter septicus]AWX14810.1 hypothetical protein CEP47_00830 [Mergibacter septicus]QDJ14062.1 hypothetical protein CEP48_00830 [Mergibacter septicus]UTU48489.1 hypothetical protein HLL31_06800 [Mergibacter septicus]WMR95882.1 hypothetical protein RDJ12_08200 [Mergibacter septicus]